MLGLAAFGFAALALAVIFPTILVSFAVTAVSHLSLAAVGPRADLPLNSQGELKFNALRVGSALDPESVPLGDPLIVGRGRFSILTSRIPPVTSILPILGSPLNTGLGGLAAAAVLPLLPVAEAGVPVVAPLAGPGGLR